MKINRYLKKNSISRRFLILMGAYFIISVIGASTLLITFHMLNNAYLTESYKLNKEEKITKELNNDFNISFFNERGYLAFGNISLKNLTLEQEAKIRDLESQYKKINSINKNQKFVNSLTEFTNYYFNDKLPLLISAYEAGDHNGVINLAKEEVTPRITSFQRLMNDQLRLLDQTIENHFQNLIRMKNEIQMVFTLFMIVTLIILLLIMEFMFQQLGRPLILLAAAANEITNGIDTTIVVDSSRHDEIGILSSSFKRMVEKVREKEQDLLAHNEELITQQEELQEQHIKLVDTLDMLREKEEKLNRHNQFINQISNSLNIHEVLDSIVVNMCKIINADKGIIALAHDSEYASVGIPKSGIYQFLDNMKTSLYEQLNSEKKPFTVKRLQDLSEKGYHEEKFYCHDLYLPVLSSDGEVIAIMMFTMYGAPSHVSQMDEFTALARNIGINLEKIALFQRSEEERKRNQDILNTLKEGVQLIDRNGTTLQINNYLSALFTCKESSLIGMPWEKWTSLMKMSVKEEQFVENLKKVLNPKLRNNDNEDTFIYTIEGSNRIMKVYSEELFHGKIKLGKVLVHQDITKNFEVDRMKSELVSTVSHELRTPLSSILGFTELMLNRELEPIRQKKYLITILNESKRLTALINDFLDVQRMESGMQTYEKKFINLLPILGNVIESQQVFANLHEILLKSDSSTPMIFGDKSKIEQAFANLLNNAIKYSPGGGMITVNVTKEDKHIKVAITDNGLGIPEDAIDKLFTKFYRVDNSDRRTIGGTGLGLSIVQEIVNEHKGRITVQSEYGKGSTFTVYLPADSSPNENMKLTPKDEKVNFLVETLQY